MVKPISINVELVDKASQKDLKLYSNAFNLCDVTRDELGDLINAGFSYCSQFKGSRKKENFIQSGFVSLDFDSWYLEQAIDHPYIQKNGAILYTTPSHRQGDNGDRFRVVFELEKPLKDSSHFEFLMLGLLQLFPQADPACKDCSRLFFGSSQSDPVIYRGLLDLKEMRRLYSVGKRHLEPPLSKKSLPLVLPKELTQEKKMSIEECRKLLRNISVKPGYDIWRNICWAIANWCRGEGYSLSLGKQLIEEWSPDYKTNGYEIDKLFKYYDGRITAGTLVFYGKGV